MKTASRLTEILKIRSIQRRKKAEKKVLPKKSWPPQSVFSAWGSQEQVAKGTGLSIEDIERLV